MYEDSHALNSRTRMFKNVCMFVADYCMHEIRHWSGLLMPNLNPGHCLETKCLKNWTCDKMKAP